MSAVRDRYVTTREHRSQPVVENVMSPERPGDIEKSGKERSGGQHDQVGVDIAAQARKYAGLMETWTP